MIEAIEAALIDPSVLSIYGDGNASMKIAEIITEGGH